MMKCLKQGKYVVEADEWQVKTLEMWG